MQICGGLGSQSLNWVVLDGESVQRTSEAIQGRTKRIALLKSMREQSHAGAPLLVSFFVRRPDEQRYKIIAALGNFFRGLAGRERIEVGDDLEPEYVHYFTEEELSKELEALLWSRELGKMQFFALFITYSDKRLGEYVILWSCIY